MRSLAKILMTAAMTTLVAVVIAFTFSAPPCAEAALAPVFQLSTAQNLASDFAGF